MTLKAQLLFPINLEMIKGHLESSILQWECLFICGKTLKIAAILSLEINHSDYT